VVRVAARGPAQDRDALAGDALPVVVERLGSRVEEHEPSAVDRSRGCGVQLGEQRSPELVGGQEVETLVADERGGAGNRGEDPLDLGPDALLGLAPTRPRSRRLRGTGEVEEVGALGVALGGDQRELEQLMHRVDLPRLPHGCPAENALKTASGRA
jgi:hypothetical protein